MNNIEIYTVDSQLYVTPTIKVTHSRYLDGYYSIDIVWIKWGLSLKWNKNE